MSFIALEYLRIVHVSGSAVGHKSYFVAFPNRAHHGCEPYRCHPMPWWCCIGGVLGNSHDAQANTRAFISRTFFLTVRTTNREIQIKGRRDECLPLFSLFSSQLLPDRN
jgi:hypothetical protein